MAMTEAERIEAEALIRAELEAEHNQRVEGVAASKLRAAERRGDKNSQHRREEMDALRIELQHKFYTENGYQIYVDSRGDELWLSPEEYAWRVKRRGNRKRNKRKKFETVPGLQPRIIAFYIAGAALAVTIGLMLVR